MATDEQSWHGLVNRLEEVLGSEYAMSLTDHMPRDIDALAEKDDIAAFQGDVDHRFEQVDRRLKQIDRRFEEVDRRFDALNERLDDKVAGLHQRIEGSKNAVLAEIRRDMARQTRLMVFSLIAAVASVAGIAYGAG